MATEDGASTLAGDRKTLSPDATLIFPNSLFQCVMS
jgi:hypothetical protein